MNVPELIQSLGDGDFPWEVVVTEHEIGYDRIRVFEVEKVVLDLSRGRIHLVVGDQLEDRSFEMLPPEFIEALEHSS